MASISKAISKLHPSIIPKYTFGSWIINHNHKKYLDLTSGIGALSTGHNHPYIKEKVISQLDRYVHIPQQVFGIHDIQNELINKLVTIMPSKNLNNFFFVNSGSEATDNAIKISRKFTGKTNIISMLKGFHGRTIGALSVTSSNNNCKLKSQPLVPGNYFCNDFTQESLNNILEYQSAPEETAAIIMEPVQGEGGIISIPKDFFLYVRKVCDENNILLIVDEVQSGAGRTGTWWNIEQKGVEPDLMTFGKGIASGWPLACLVGKNYIMNNIGTSYLGGTYGGNAIASAATLASIEIIENENLLNNTNIMGSYIKNSLKNFEEIKEIRQYGLMIAIEFNFSNQNPEKVKKIVEYLREYNILVLMAGNKNQYIRLLPPLTITEVEIDYFLAGFQYAIDKINSK
jgi:4-aminobutyrate aminotransferase-like enzyme